MNPGLATLLVLAAGAASSPPSTGACRKGNAVACKALAEKAASGLRRDVAAALADDLRAGCEAGNQDACAGWVHAEPARSGVALEDELQRLSTACAGGSALGCALRSETRLRTASTPEAIRAVLLDLDQDCRRVGSSPCFTLSSIYARGFGDIPADEGRSTALLQRACDTGSAFACYEDGMRLVELGQHAAARPRYARACDAGLPQPCFNLGHLVLHGQGGPIDPDGGRKLILAACTGGDGGACDFLAASDEGRREPAQGPLDEKGLGLARRYCELGGSDSCAAAAFHIGSKAEASGDLESMDEVIGLLQTACSRESARSCNALGHIAMDAVRACEGGDGLQCLVAGFVHERGVRIPRANGASLPADPAAARAAFRRACASKLKAGCVRITPPSGSQR